MVRIDFSLGCQSPILVIAISTRFSVTVDIELRRDELNADWDLAVSGEVPYKIAPL